MGFFESIFLGLIQGLTEFLPVSSSGHLALVQNIFPGLRGTPLLFDVLLHCGTLVAVCAAFRKDIAVLLREVGRMIAGLFSAENKGKGQRNILARRLILMIVIGTLPLFLAILLSGVADAIMREPLAIGLLLCATGLLLYISDRLPQGKKSDKNARMTDALVVGVCQGIAVLPGFSRAGATISGGLFCKFERPFAVRFSFLLSIPAVLGATLLEIFKVLDPATSVKAADDAALGGYEALTPYFIPCLFGMLVAAFVGYIAIGLVRRLISRGKFGGFAYYCLGLGFFTAILSLILS